MNVEQESLIVVRDDTGQMIAVVAKKGAVVEIYETSLTGYDDVADLLVKISGK